MCKFFRPGDSTKTEKNYKPPKSSRIPEAKILVTEKMEGVELSTLGLMGKCADKTLFYFRIHFNGPHSFLLQVNYCLK